MERAAHPVERRCPFTQAPLTGVANALEQSGAQSIIVGSINTGCCNDDILDYTERVLEQIQHSLHPKHPHLRGYVILTPNTDEEGVVRYDRYAISFDLLDYEEAALMMQNLPSGFYTGRDDEVYLKYDWNNLDAAEAITRLRFIHDQGGDGYSYMLPTKVEMYPFTGSVVQRSYHGGLAAHFGARPINSDFHFIAV